MFVSFTLFNLTLDERKTLTKISTRKLLTTVPQTSARFRHNGTRKPAKSILHNETTPRVEVASHFCITAAQLHKAVTGVDYQSGPHPYKGKWKATDTDSTTPTKLQKIDAGPSPVPSTSGETPK